MYVLRLPQAAPTYHEITSGENLDFGSALKFAGTEGCAAAPLPREFPVASFKLKLTNRHILASECGALSSVLGGFAVFVRWL